MKLITMFLNNRKKLKGFLDLPVVLIYCIKIWRESLQLDQSYSFGDLLWLSFVSVDPSTISILRIIS